mmetsp:Transcript_40474/g.94631  ORF Transcript_40474/g.94631 Transcript_40474/m.94631 type:complete len:336 (-) Transcript_40474:36-1043(-)
MNPNAAVFVPGGYGHSMQPSIARTQTATLPKVAETEEELKLLMEYLGKEEILSLDCEGSDLSKGSWRQGRLQNTGPTHGRLCLLQIGTLRGEAFAVDILKLGSRGFDLGLRHMIESEHPIKVVHDFRQDTDALWHQFGVQPRGLFDCQLCDVFIRRLMGCRTTYVNGSAKLLEQYRLLVNGSGVSKERKQAIHDRFSQDRHLWERRPLMPEMLDYALEDVRPMLQLQQKLLTDLIARVGAPEAAWQLIIEGSAAYAFSFALLQDCRCRLCCQAGDNAKFDGHSLLQRMQALPTERLNQRLVHMLRRPEDSEVLPLPGPSRFYINEHDESVPLPQA